MKATNWLRLSAALALPLLLVACQSGSGKETIARLRHVQIEIKEEPIAGGLEKAMEGYQRFLEETPDSALTAEAIRRLADLKIEKEYGLLAGATLAERRIAASALPPPPATETASAPVLARTPEPLPGESAADFEKRAALAAVAAAPAPAEGEDDLERVGAHEAIELYKKLLHDHPDYARNDQVLYQMSRAYEELGQVEAAMEVMDQLVRTYPQSRYLDEVQFRRAEYFFTRRHYLEAEAAYSSIVSIGTTSSYYQLALYKLGWTFYKQDLYDEALHRFIALLDYKVTVGYDFAQTADVPERQRIDDTFRIISLSFSNLGGANSVVEYFSRYGARSYEDGIYSNLGEFYYGKRRYADAAATYNAFVSRNPFHKVAPQFAMRVIEIHLAGAFPSLVIDAKKQFANSYGLQAAYWQHFAPSDRPEVLAWLKTNLTDLANHYHALYQSPQQRKERETNFAEAMHWYREFLTSFPSDPESPAVNYMLADLFLENRSFARAAAEYEKTAYGYPLHAKSAQAGYAAIYAYREELGAVAAASKDPVKREVVRSSLQFADTYPEHEKAALVLGAAADDLYELHDYEPAVVAARKLIATFPGAEAEIMRAAWLVVGHATYELLRYSEAETAYVQVLALVPAEDKSREVLIDNLAAAVYKQGEAANGLADYRVAAGHFLRVGQIAPTSKIRVTAEYDAAAALIQLKDWKQAAVVLLSFRDLFPGDPLQLEVTKKIAFVYREDGQIALAAAEYERIESESGDDEVRREALLIAAELHEKVGDKARTLLVYRRYVDAFPQPLELNLETRNKIAGILKEKDDQKGYQQELREIVTLDLAAGKSRTVRTRYLGATAALILTEPKFATFAEVRLVKPFDANLRKKRELMKTATAEFTRLLDYEVGEVTAAATFYLAEIYAHFCTALLASERPEGLTPLELEQYELAIEEQAYPFEDKAITVHEQNLELLTLGIYNDWIDKSLEKLAVFVPARYARPEEPTATLASLSVFIYEIERPVAVAPELEAPASEEPASEVPASEVPASEVPASEVPASEVPASEVPASEVPAPEEPASPEAEPAAEPLSSAAVPAQLAVK